LIAPSTASVPLLMKKQQPKLARRHRGKQPRERRAPRLEQFLAVERHAAHLILNRFDDARVIDARAEDAVAAEAIDVFPPEQILQLRAVAGPLERRELARLRDGFAIGNEAAVDVLSHRRRPSLQ
jgi:hypothetical protein